MHLAQASHGIAFWRLVACVLAPILQDWKQTWSKSKHPPENSSEIDTILAWATKWQHSLFVTQVVIAQLCSDELYCPFDQSGVAVAGATNSMNARQSEAVTVALFFLPLHSTLLTSPHLPKGIILYSTQFHLHQETKKVAH